MKKLVFLLSLLIALPVASFSAQQTLNNGDGLGVYRGKENSNFTELYGRVVGDCTGWPCFDGTSDGGQLLKFYGNNGFWTGLQGGAPTANRNWRLPIEAAPSAGVTSVVTVDEYGNMHVGADIMTLGGGGSMAYPSAGVPNSTGSAWGTSYTVGTSANNLVQLNGSGYLPALNGSLLTNLPNVSLPSLTGNSGKYLTNNGSTTSWGTPSGTLPATTTAGDFLVSNGSTYVTTSTADTLTALGITFADLTATSPLSLTSGTLSIVPDATHRWWTDTLASTLSGKQDTPSNASTLVKITESGGNPLWNGSAWPGGSGSFSFDSFPSYSDSAHSSGIAVNSTTLAVWNGTKWMTSTLSDSLSPTPVSPTFSSMIISGSSGNVLTAGMSASTSIGAGGNGGMSLSCGTAGAVTATYGSGAPGSSIVYSLSPAVTSVDTCVFTYTQPGNGLEATSGGADVATVSSGSTTNNSTYSTGGSAIFTEPCDNFTANAWTNESVGLIANGTYNVGYANDATAPHKTYKDVTPFNSATTAHRLEWDITLAPSISTQGSLGNAGAFYVLFKNSTGDSPIPDWSYLLAFKNDTSTNGFLRYEGSFTEITSFSSCVAGRKYHCKIEFDGSGHVIYTVTDTVTSTSWNSGNVTASGTMQGVMLVMYGAADNFGYLDNIVYY